MDWTNIQGKKYPGYGRCIYCGGDGGADGLRSEHVIPLSLEGATEIKEANCVTCQNTVNRVDTHLARHVFYEYRRHVGAPSRNPRDQPRLPPVAFTVRGEEINRELPIQERPYSLAMPIWGAPGFFRGTTIDAPFPEPYCHMYHHAPAGMREILGLEPEEDFLIWSKSRVDVSLFARAIAKIAYCHTVIVYGLDGFRPLILPDIILGRSSATPYFVGAPLNDPPPPLQKGQRHFVRLTHLDAKPGHSYNALGRLSLIVASVRLFADSGTKEHGLPEYQVITGARSPLKIDNRRPILPTPKEIRL